MTRKGSQRSLLDLQIKSIPSTSRNLLCDESHQLTGEAKANEYLEDESVQPTQKGKGQKKKKLEISRGDYCQGQDRYQGREEIKRRSFQKIKNKKNIWAGMLLATIPLFFFIPECFLAFFSWVHPQSMSATISELFYSASCTGWNHSRFACRLNHNVYVSTLYLHPSPFLFSCHSFS